MPAVDELKQRLARSLKRRELELALGALAELERLEPHNASWPRRAARLLRATRDERAELAALHRALELQVDQALALDAIASCRAILEISPEDPRALECLDLLDPELDGAHDSEATLPDAAFARANRQRGRSDSPLDSLLLKEVVPGARSVQVGDAKPGGVNEIPVDRVSASHADEPVDLHLEAWPSPQALRDIAAAQAASLPLSARSASAGPRASLRSSPAASRGSSLRNELANIPLFGDLDPASLHTLIRNVRVVSLDAGEVLFRQGDPASSLYVVVDGAVVPIAEGERRRKLAVLERGAFFGEIGLLTKQPRNATIEALVETRLLAIDRRLMWELIGRVPSVAKGLLRFLRARLIDRQIRTNLFFAAFAHAERDAVARQFRIFEVEDGTRIVAQGKPPEGLFVVLAGSLEVVDRRRAKTLAELGPGDVFGGLSLLAGEPAASDIVARGKCWLVVLGEGRLRRIVEANPRLERILLRLAKEGGIGTGSQVVSAG